MLSVNMSIHPSIYLDLALSLRHANFLAVSVMLHGPPNTQQKYKIFLCFPIVALGFVLSCVCFGPTRYTLCDILMQSCRHSDTLEDCYRVFSPQSRKQMTTVCPHRNTMYVSVALKTCILDVWIRCLSSLFLVLLSAFLINRN